MSDWVNNHNKKESNKNMCIWTKTFILGWNTVLIFIFTYSLSIQSYPLSAFFYFTYYIPVQVPLNLSWNPFNYP